MKSFVGLQKCIIMWCRLLLLNVTASLVNITIILCVLNPRVHSFAKITIYVFKSEIHIYYSLDVYVYQCRSCQYLLL